RRAARPPSYGQSPLPSRSARTPGLRIRRDEVRPPGIPPRAGPDANVPAQHRDARDAGGAVGLGRRKGRSSRGRSRKAEGGGDPGGSGVPESRRGPGNGAEESETDRGRAGEGRRRDRRSEEGGGRRGRRARRRSEGSRRATGPAQ